MSISNRAAVRVNRRGHYVHIESSTARDVSVSYRALGLLTYLLDQRDDWQVRSEQLSQPEARESRDAVRKTLRELAAAGYYRLERRRFRDGKQAMGTAVSEFSVPQWVADHVTFGGKPIPVVEQSDGTFKVLYRDGSLGPDGFEPGPDNSPPPGLELPEEDDSPEDEPAAPAPKPARKSPARKRTAAKTSGKPAAAQDDAAAAEKKMLDDAAEAVASWWWADAEQKLGVYVGKKNGYVAMRQQVKAALAKGYTQQECALALRHARQHWPSSQQWQTALGVVTKNIAPQRGRPVVAYSDSATWGATPDTPTPPADNNVTFGLLAD
ncbi:hypothetical protein ACIO3O_37185 [Streptomyces sp. NPDC087440]|uniref:hypothetical protein n=1 Tax=Streptomyces sp. NPDC087440 TaxID=3365790 RepID=UPI0038290B10